MKKEAINIKDALQETLLAKKLAQANQNYFRIGSCFWKFKSFGYFSDAFAKAYQNIIFWC
jgi:hypothetical protein